MEGQVGIHARSYYRSEVRTSSKIVRLNNQCKGLWWCGQEVYGLDAGDGLEEYGKVWV